MAPKFGELKLNATFGSNAGGTFGTILGNNSLERVFGDNGKSFINSIIAGDSVDVALGHVAQGFSQMAMNLASDAIGGMLSGALKIGAEKAKSLVSENKIDNANNNAQKAANEGAENLESIIAEASTAAGLLSADLAYQIQLLDDNAGLIGSQKDELEKNVKLMQVQIKNYNEKKAERDRVKAEYESADESKKEELQKKLNGLNAELSVFASPITKLQSNVSNSQKQITNAIAQAQTVQKWAVKTQEELVAKNDNTQVALNNTAENTESIVMTNTSIAANEITKYYSNSEGRIKYGQNLQTGGFWSSLIPVVGVAKGAVDTGLARQFIDLGNNGKSFSNGAWDIVQGIGNEWLAQNVNINSSLAPLNSTMANIDTSLSEMPNIAQAQIDDATTVIEEDVLKEEFSA